MIKTQRYVATQTVTTAQTTTVPVGEGGTFGQYDKMDVVAVVNTLTGGGSMTLKVQEWFALSVGSTTGFFLTTAQATTITSTQNVVFLNYDPTNSIGNYNPPSSGSNPMLNKGMQKQIVTSSTGSVTAFNMDVVFIYYNS